MDKVLQKFANLKQMGPLNKLCADCGLMKTKLEAPKSPVSHVCTINGVFICQNCADLHKQFLSKSISDVRQLPDAELDIPNHESDNILSKKDSDELNPEKWDKVEIDKKIQRSLRQESNEIILIEEWNWLEDSSDNSITCTLVDALNRGGNFRFLMYMQNYFGSEMISPKEANIIELQDSLNPGSKKRELAVLEPEYKVDLKEHIIRKYNSQPCQFYRYKFMGSVPLEQSVSKSNANQSQSSGQGRSHSNGAEESKHSEVNQGRANWTNSSSSGGDPSDKAADDWVDVGEAPELSFNQDLQILEFDQNNDEDLSRDDLKQSISELMLPP